MAEHSPEAQIHILQSYFNALKSYFHPDYLVLFIPVISDHSICFHPVASLVFDFLMPLDKGMIAKVER